MIKSKQTIITDCGECTNNENTTYQLMEYHQGFTQRNIHSIEQLSYQAETRKKRRTRHSTQEVREKATELAQRK